METASVTRAMRGRTRGISRQCRRGARVPPSSPGSFSRESAAQAPSAAEKIAMARNPRQRAEPRQGRHQRRARRHPQRPESMGPAHHGQAAVLLQPAGIDVQAHLHQRDHHPDGGQGGEEADHPGGEERQAGQPGIDRQRHRQHPPGTEDAHQPPGHMQHRQQTDRQAEKRIGELGLVQPERLLDQRDQRQPGPEGQRLEQEDGEGEPGRAAMHGATLGGGVRKRKTRGAGAATLPARAGAPR